MIKRKFFGIFIVFIFIAYCAWVFLRFQTSTQVLSNPKDVAILNFLKDTSFLRPINQIVFTKETDCPVTYDSVPYGQFGGLKKGCTCLDGKTFIGECPSTASNCQANNDIEPLDIQIWGTKMRACIKRVNEVSYLPLNEDGTYNFRDLYSNMSFLGTAKGECPSGSRKCNKYTCIDVNEECPIVSVVLLKVTGKTDPPLPSGYAQVKAQTGYFVAQGGAQYVIAVLRGSNSETGNLINNITTTLGGTPCFTPIENPRRLNNLTFSNEKLDQSGCISYGEDTNYSSVLDSQTEYDTYSSNSLLNSLPSNFVQLVQKNGDRIFLFTRRTIPMKDINQCQLSTSGRLSNVQSILSSSYTFLYWCFVIFLFFLACGIIFYIMLLCMGDRSGTKIIAITVTMAFVFSSLILILQYFLVQERWSSANRIVDYYLDLCSPIEGVYQNVVSTTRSQAKDAITELIWISTISIAVGAVTMVLHFAFLYNILRRKPEDQQELLQHNAPIGNQMNAPSVQPYY